MSERVNSEEELIERFLRPLTLGCPGAMALADDCARIAVPHGEELIVTCDAVAAGVHFFAEDAPEDIAWKALAVNVSDLAGKGATPFVYLMALSFPEAPETAWLERFATGLARAQQHFGISLAGGDTDRRPGPLTITITALGTVPQGRAVSRAGARPGDQIYVSGTLGDAALGLLLRQAPERAKAWQLEPAFEDALRARYLRPTPRLALREAILAGAAAAMDISDGLAKDLGRLTMASGCGARIDLGRVPLSAAVRAALSRDASLMTLVLSGGDDYEILVTVRPTRSAVFEAQAREAGLAVTAIGSITGATGVEIVDANGAPVRLPRTGWEHFS